MPSITQTHRSSVLPTAGGGKKSTIKARNFAILSTASSDDSEEELTPRPTLSKINENDPYRQAMSSGSSWGDIALAEEGETPPMRLISPVEWEERRLSDLATQETEIWAQPFARGLTAYYADVYDTRALTDDEYEACLTWLYEKGWYVESETREGFKANPDNLPPRVWVSPLAARFDTPPVCDRKEHCCVPRMKKVGVVPRFCRVGVACVEAGCRYVHEDTIARINEPCNFGAGCGAADPAKRALCIRMHPGETWTADMVIHRPVEA